MAQESSLKVKDLEAQLLKKDDTISQLISATVSELTKSLKEREKENETQLRCLQEKMDSLESKVKSGFGITRCCVTELISCFQFDYGLA